MKKIKPPSDYHSNFSQTVAVASHWPGAVIFGIFAASLQIAFTAAAQNAFFQTNLVSDLAGYANRVDTNLVNPWGIATSATSPFWVNDNGTGLSTVYNSSGTPSLIVTIPPPGGSTNTAAPSGIVFNNTTNFLVTTNAAKFIFDTEDGTISAWASGATAILKVDNSASNAVYKGLCLASNNGNPYLYAADFHNGQIDVYNKNWNPTNLSGDFSDPTIPTGFAPFSIQLIGTNLYVAYALQDAEKHDDVPGNGNGYVNIFDTGGNLLQRLITQGALNSPWAIVLAPPGFGPFGGDLLVGNFGNGFINAFNPATGAWLDSLNDSNGVPISMPGLWGLVFGNGGNGGAPNTLYFAAGIAGPDIVEDHGLLGALTPMFPTLESGLSYHQTNLVSDLAGMAAHQDTTLVNPWGISFSSSSPFWISDNGTGLSTVYNGTGTLMLTVTIPPPGGSTNTAAPSGTVFNTTTVFDATTTASKFIFDTEDGTISAWASGSAAILKVDNSISNTVYKGLALASNGAGPYLYAADFHNARIDVYNESWEPATLNGNFVDTNIPAGFAPFNIVPIAGNLYVTYALQDSEKHDDIPGPGNGYVDIFDTSGILQQRLISQGALNSPWGVTWAPAGFGLHANHLLVGNFGDGRINAYNPETGAWLGPLYTSDGNPFSEPGLWSIVFGNGGNGGNPHTLYFTAGIAGPDIVEDHGLFGALAPVAPAFVTFPTTNSTITLTWSGDAGPFEVQMATNLESPQWTTFLTTTNLSVTVTNNVPNAYFRVINEGD